MPPHLQQLEERVRYAFACKRYADALPLAAQFAKAVVAYARGLPKGDARAGDAGRKAIDLFSWSLATVQRERAKSASQLQRVTAAKRYSRRSAELPTTAGIQLEA